MRKGIKEPFSKLKFKKFPQKVQIPRYISNLIRYKHLNWFARGIKFPWENCRWMELPAFYCKMDGSKSIFIIIRGGIASWAGKCLLSPRLWNTKKRIFYLIRTAQSVFWFANFANFIFGHLTQILLTFWRFYALGVCLALNVKIPTPITNLKKPEFKENRTRTPDPEIFWSGLNVIAADWLNFTQKGIPTLFVQFTGPEKILQ